MIGDEDHGHGYKKTHRAGAPVGIWLTRDTHAVPPINRGINPASASAMRVHFGCTFETTADCAM